MRFTLIMYALDTVVYFKNPLGFKATMPIDTWKLAGEPTSIKIDVPVVLVKDDLADSISV